jgi:hypothetical protein
VGSLRLHRRFLVGERNRRKVLIDASVNPRGDLLVDIQDVGYPLLP